MNFDPCETTGDSFEALGYNTFNDFYESLIALDVVVGVDLYMHFYMSFLPVRVFLNIRGYGEEVKSFSETFILGPVGSLVCVMGAGRVNGEVMFLGSGQKTSASAAKSDEKTNNFILKICFGLWKRQVF